MSDIQDLIHKTSIDCIEKGQVMERERIIKLIESQITPCLCDKDCMADDNPAYQELIELIKGETK